MVVNSGSVFRSPCCGRLRGKAVDHRSGLELGAWSLTLGPRLVPNRTRSGGCETWCSNYSVSGSDSTVSSSTCNVAPGEKRLVVLRRTGAPQARPWAKTKLAFDVPCSSSSSRVRIAMSGKRKQAAPAVWNCRRYFGVNGRGKALRGTLTRTSRPQLFRKQLGEGRWSGRLGKGAAQGETDIERTVLGIASH